MSDHGGEATAAGSVRRSRIADYAEYTDMATDTAVAEAVVDQPAPELDTTPNTPPTSGDSLFRRRRREAAALLGEFRRTAVLLPLGDDGSPLVSEFGGIQWIYAFSDEAALARFAIARGEGSREWAYDRVLGARLLDVAIPAMNVPHGVALDVGSDGEGALFPPVRGIVPDAAAVDARKANEEPAR